MDLGVEEQGVKGHFHHLISRGNAVNLTSIEDVGFFNIKKSIA